MEETATPTRAEIPETDKWDLRHLFQDVGKWHEDVAWVQANYLASRRLEGQTWALGLGSRGLPRVRKGTRSENRAPLPLRLAPTRGRRIEYRVLWRESGSCRTCLPPSANWRHSFLRKSRASTTSAGREFLNDPVLSDWRIQLHKIRRMRPHVLSEKEERLLALGAAALDGYDDAFSQLTNVDMKFGSVRDDEGRGATTDAKHL